MLQAKETANDDISRARGYWEGLFALLAEAGESLYAGREIQCDVCGLQVHELERELADQLRAVSRNQQLGMYSLLLSGLALTLFKFTGVPDVIVSSPVYGQSSFNQYVPVHLRMEPDMTARDLLVRTRENLLAGYKNQFYPLDNAGGLRAVEERFGALTKMLLMLEGLHSFGSVLRIVHSADNDITLRCKDNGDVIQIEALYHTGYMDSAAMSAFLEGYEATLSYMLSFPSGRLEDAGALRLAREPLTVEGVASSDVADKRSDISDPVEAQVTAAWLKVSGKSSAEPERSFLELGGNSIQILKLVAELNSVYPKAVNPADVFTHSTIRLLSVFIRNRLEEESRSAMPSARHRQLAAVQLPRAYFHPQVSGQRLEAALTYTLSERAAGNIEQYTSLRGLDPVSLIHAICLYYFSELSGNKTVAVCLLHDKGRQMLPLKVDVGEFPDLPALMQYVEHTRRTTPYHQYLELDEIRAAKQAEGPYGVFPLIFNLSNTSFRQEWLSGFDLMLGARWLEHEMRLTLRYNGGLLRNGAVREYFQTLVAYIEEAAVHLQL